jgi:hypothetical protein
LDEQHLAEPAAQLERTDDSVVTGIQAALAYAADLAQERVLPLPA